MAGKKHKTPFVPKSSGERVAHARRLLGVHEGRDILAPDLAERCGVTINAVYAWETGTVPGKKNLERLADELGVTPHWIHYGVIGTPEVAQPDTINIGGLEIDRDSIVRFSDAELADAVRQIAEEEARERERAAPAPAPRKVVGKKRRPR